MSSALDSVYGLPIPRQRKVAECLLDALDQSDVAAAGAVSKQEEVLRCLVLLKDAG
jgi:hypothetical protein